MTRPRRDRRTPRLPTSCPRLLLLLLVVALAPASAVGQDAPAELFILHGDDDSDSTSERARGVRLLAVQGAGRFERDALTPWTDLLGDGALGPAPRSSCPAGEALRAAASLTAEVEGSLQSIQYGRNDLAIQALSGVADALPCAGEPLDDALLARLWFLLGAVHFLDERQGDARSAFERAALVDQQVPFDELFPPSVHDALLAAKDEVLQRSKARITVFSDAEVRIDGRLVPMTDGAGQLDALLGPRLVQVTADGRTRSFEVDLSAVPARDGVASLALFDQPGLDRALRALATPDAKALPIASAAVLGVLAERGDTYALVVSSRRDRTRDERPLTALDVVTATAGPFKARNSQADVFGRRARIAMGPMYRVLGRPNESALHYGGVEAIGWIPVHWLIRAGFGARWTVTPRPAPDGKSACCSTFEVTPRVRFERGTGTIRPFGELGFLLFWPAPRTEGAAPGLLDVTAGFDLGGGVMVVPGEDRRLGIALSGFAGGIGGIGPMGQARLSVELRF